jgi:hypothetical protein
MGSWMWFVANISKGYLHFMDWVWSFIWLWCNIWETKLCRIWGSVLDPWFQCWHQYGRVYYTWVIFENGSGSQGVRGMWKTSLLSNRHLFLGWLEVFYFALWGQSFCSSKLLFLFQSSWRIDTLIWVFPNEQKLFDLFLFHLIELVI